MVLKKLKTSFFVLLSLTMFIMFCTSCTMQTLSEQQQTANEVQNAALVNDFIKRSTSQIASNYDQMQYELPHIQKLQNGKYSIKLDNEKEDYSQEVKYEKGDNRYAMNVEDQSWENALESAKQDLSKLIQQLCNVDVSTSLNQVRLVTDEMMYDELSQYRGGKNVYVNIHVTHQKLQYGIIVHEMVHYLIKQTNINESSLFAKEDAKVQNYWLNEGIAVMFSEYLSGCITTNSNEEEQKSSQVVLQEYGKEVLLDAFTGRNSTIENESKNTSFS